MEVGRGIEPGAESSGVQGRVAQCRRAALTFGTPDVDRWHLILRASQTLEQRLHSCQVVDGLLAGPGDAGSLMVNQAQEAGYCLTVVQLTPNGRTGKRILAVKAGGRY